MSELYIEINYAKIIGQQLDRFNIKKESPAHYNSRCYVCGDSAKKKNLARFHILEKSGKLMCYCHNCGYSNSFVFFMKTYFPNSYQEFIFDKYKNNATYNQPIITSAKVIATILPESIKVVQNAIFKLDLPLVSDLPKDHPVAVYVASRLLPAYPFQFAEKFYEFSSQFNEELLGCKQDEPRLIIPFLDKKGNTFAYQGRSLEKYSALKYVTIRINKKIPNIFGLDRCVFSKRITIVEGPIDSLFIKNCIASVNASLVSTAEKLKSIVKKENITLVYDCEPRNLQICKMYQAAISAGYSVVIWPSGNGEKVDINDLVKLGIDPQKIIDENTYRGLSAQIVFDKWKRI